jgi:hypothetical protein
VSDEEMLISLRHFALPALDDLYSGSGPGSPEDRALELLADIYSDGSDPIETARRRSAEVTGARQALEHANKLVVATLDIKIAEGQLVLSPKILSYLKDINPAPAIHSHASPQEAAG